MGKEEKGKKRLISSSGPYGMHAAMSSNGAVNGQSQRNENDNEETLPVDQTPNRKGFFSMLTSAIATPITDFFSRISPMGKGGEKRVPLFQEGELEEMESEVGLEEPNAPTHHHHHHHHREENGLDYSSNGRGIGNLASLDSPRIQHRMPGKIQKASASLSGPSSSSAVKAPIIRDYHARENSDRKSSQGKSLLSDYFSRRKGHLNGRETDTCLKVLDDHVSRSTGGTSRRKVPVFYGALNGGEPIKISTAAARTEVQPLSTSHLIRNLSASKDVEMVEVRPVSLTPSSSGLGSILANPKPSAVSDTALLILNALKGGTPQKKDVMMTGQTTEPFNVSSTWTCSGCNNLNKKEDSNCLRCSRSFKTNSVSSNLTTSPFSTLVSTPSVIASKKGWNCSSCMISNDANSRACVCCEAPNPNVSKESSKQQTVAAPPKPAISFGAPKPAISFGAPKPVSTVASSAKWTCSSCMVINDADKSACPCCEAPNPNGPKEDQKKPSVNPVSSFGGIKFGAQASNVSSPAVPASLSSSAAASFTIPSGGISFGSTGFKPSFSAATAVASSAVSTKKRKEEPDDDDDVIIIDSDSDEGDKSKKVKKTHEMKEEEEEAEAEEIEISDDDDDDDDDDQSMRSENDDHSDDNVDESNDDDDDDDEEMDESEKDKGEMDESEKDEGIMNAVGGEGNEVEESFELLPSQSHKSQPHLFHDYKDALTKISSNAAFPHFDFS